MKSTRRSKSKRLAIRTEILRELTRTDLKEVVGGELDPPEPSHCGTNSCLLKPV